MICVISNGEVSFTGVLYSVGSVVLVVGVVVGACAVYRDGYDCVCREGLDGGDVVGLGDERWGRVEEV